jgi:hypothetical protein
MCKVRVWLGKVRGSLGKVRVWLGKVRSSMCNVRPFADFSLVKAAAGSC